jgi:hypothetical protein
MSNCLLEPGTGNQEAELDEFTESLPTILLKPQPQAPGFLSTANSTVHNSARFKKMRAKFKTPGRLTPFLLFVFILPLIFIYVINAEKQADILFRLGLLLVFEINIIFFDFALCNYFEGKKLLRIWLIELPLIWLIVSLIL